MKTDPFPIITVHEERQPSFLETTGETLQAVFLLTVLLLTAFHPRNEAFTTFSIIFSSIILEAFPFMLLGTLIGGGIEVFVERDKLVRWLPQNRLLSIVLSAFLGLLFPICECAIVPIVRKFIQKGLPLGSATAFLLGGPIVNPLVFSSTLVAYSFSLETAVLRFFAGAGIAISVGVLIDFTLSERQALLPVVKLTGNGPDDHCGCGTAGCVHAHPHEKPHTFMEKVWAGISHGAADFYDIGRFLIFGAFIAAVLQTFVPRTVFFAVADSPFLAIGACMTLAVVLNLCSEADAFIAASFQPLGISFSGQLAFMVLGPMLDIKLILMYLSVFKKKMILLLIFLVCFHVFFATAALEVFQWFID